MEIITDQLLMTKVQSVRHLNENTFVLRIERNGIKFYPGQHMVIGFPGEMENREYSIYSSQDADYLEFLIKEVDGGDLSNRLKLVAQGTELQIQGPFGFFILPQDELVNQEYVFIASGTGIAPFHSMIMSHSELNYKLIHGVKYLSETYDKKEYVYENYEPCISRESGDHFHGRVTDYSIEHESSKNAIYYLCGNSAMIDQVLDILQEKGVDAQNIRTEVYF